MFDFPFVDKYQFTPPRTKRISLFGSGIIAKKTLDYYSNSSVVKIFDNSKNLWGQKYNGIKICNPTEILKNDFIIITSTSYNEISKQLIKKKLKPKIDFIISPILNDRKIIDNLENKKVNLIFTSGSPPNQNKNYGGGLYQLSINKYDSKCKKIFSGNCYGIFKNNKNFFVIDEERGVVVLDKKLNIKKTYKLQKNLRPHGISYHEKSSTFFINSTEQDTVLRYDKNFKLINEIPISHKKIQTGIKHHHINDNLVCGDSLYISMFSYSGNYTKEVYDGVILEYDILDLDKKPVIVKDNLWMPHNIKYYNKSLFILNSLPGQLMGYNMQILGEFPAFTRGLAYDNQHFYIGQSKNRNYSKYLGVSKNISIDAGIILFDEKTKVSRFFQVDPRISEIHAIEVV